MSDPELNPALEAAAIAQAFARDGRVHVPDILTADSAARVHHCLAQETDFAIVTKNADGYVRLRPGASLTPQQQSDLMRDAFDKARDAFHYVYDNHPMSQDGEPYPDPAHPLAAVTRFLNSAPLLDFARRVTGSGEIATIDLLPEGSPAANPAFDVTPARLVTALVTDRGVCPASEPGLLSLYPERAET